MVASRHSVEQHISLSGTNSAKQLELHRIGRSNSRLRFSSAGNVCVAGRFAKTRFRNDEVSTNTHPMAVRRLIPIFIAVLAATGGPAETQSRDRAAVPRVHLAISCQSSQGEFDRAVELLHNFFFPETVKAFKAIIQHDPNCAMAYWGLAMSQRPNPLVPPFPRANLVAGWEAAQRGKLAKEQTPRESQYLSAIEAFYRDYDSVDQLTRTRRYENEMHRLHQRYPNDSEAAIFYALALNEAVDFKDTSFSRQRKAAAILKFEARKHPFHPGIAHYIIHSYDFAPLAARALPSADLYGMLAADAPHALHMPSHTYSMLGMWENSILANRAAMAASAAYAARNFPEATDPALPHLLDFLVYAYLQLGKDKEARQILGSLSKLKPFASVRLTVDTALAAMPARFALERGRWDEAADLPVRDSQYLPAQSISYFARALGSARSGKSDAALNEISHLQGIKDRLAATKDDFWAGQTDVQIEAAEAWVLFGQGRRSEAVARMRHAADLDDTSVKNVAMENKLVPMRELFGELYAASGNNINALAQFERSLKANPNRFRSLAGAAIAARRAGQAATAKRFYRALLTLTRASDGDRTEIVDAKSYLASN